MKNSWRSGVAIACLLFAGHSYAAGGADLVPKAKQLTGVPILVFGEGNVAAKVLGKITTRFQYLDGVLTTSVSADGTRGDYFYRRDGLLDRIVYSNGIVQTPHFDGQGNLYGFTSSSGKALQISGNVRAGRKMLVMPASGLSAPQPSAATAGGAQTEALVNLLIAAEGWETQAANADTNATTGCDNNDDDAQQRVGTAPQQSRAVAQLSTATDDTPVTSGCDVVIISGPGGGGEGGGGGGGGAGSPGSGGVPSDYPPGTAGADQPSQQPCLNGAYRAWQQMDALCRAAPNQREANVCNEVKWRLYNEEIEYCKTL